MSKKWILGSFLAALLSAVQAADLDAGTYLNDRLATKPLLLRTDIIQTTRQVCETKTCGNPKNGFGDDCVRCRNINEPISKQLGVDLPPSSRTNVK